MALSLATLTRILSGGDLQSISASYHVGGWARDIFVGFLFAIAAFLLAYNGRSKTEMISSKIAAIAAIGIAMFPCGCDSHKEIIPNLHGLSAAVMFCILTYFCFQFYKRASSKQHTQAKIRACIYAVCGLVMASSIIILAIDSGTNGAISAHVDNLIFKGEAAALIAFGIAWLLASLAIPIVTSSDERHSVFK